MKNIKFLNVPSASGAAASGKANQSFKVYSDQLKDQPGMRTRLDKVTRAKVAHIDDRGDIIEREALYGFERGNDERIISSPIIRQAIGLVKGRYFAPEFVKPFFVSPDLSPKSSSLKMAKIFGRKISELFAMRRNDPAIGYPAVMTFWRIPDAFGALSSRSLVFQVATFGGKISDTLLWNPEFLHPETEAVAKANIQSFFAAPGIEFPHEDARVDVEEIAAAFDLREEDVACRGNKFIPKLFLDCINGLSETWPVKNKSNEVVSKANRMADTTIPCKRVMNWVRNAPMVVPPVKAAPVQEKAPEPTPTTEPVQKKAPEPNPVPITAPAVDPSELAASLQHNQIGEQAAPPKVHIPPTVKTVSMDD